MKKHKSHARHVFNHLEKIYGINIVFGDDEERKSQKKSIGDRRSQVVQKAKGPEQMIATQPRVNNSNSIHEQKTTQRKSKNKKGKKSTLQGSENSNQEDYETSSQSKAGSQMIFQKADDIE